jgi:hypothetical protein
MGLGAKKLAKRHDCIPELIPTGSEVASTIRNHWDALVSWYTSMKEARDISLYEWLTEYVAILKTRAAFHFKEHRLYWKYLPLTSRVLRYETIKEDLAALLGDHGFPGEPREFPVFMDQKSRRDGRGYREFYDEKTRLWVADYYHEEIEELGYEF